MLQEPQGNGLELTTILIQCVRSDPEQDTTNHIEGQPIHPFGDIDPGPCLASMTPCLHYRLASVNHHLGKRGHLPPVKGRLHQTTLLQPAFSLTRQQTLALQGSNGLKE